MSCLRDHFHRFQLRAVIVENSFTSLREMADIVFPFLKVFSSLVSAAQRLFMDSISKVQTVQVPIMFISGLQVRFVCLPTRQYIIFIVTGCPRSPSSYDSSL